MTPRPEPPALLPAHEPGGPRWYAMDHIVTVGETSRARFVYYSHLFSWQGVCRERFGFENCPQYMRSLTQDYAMLTTTASCEFLAEIFEADRISLRLAIPWLRLHLMKGLFEFVRIGRSGDSGDGGIGDGAQQLVARGEQTWANTLRSGDPDHPVFTPAPWSPELLDACIRMGTDISRALTR